MQRSLQGGEKEVRRTVIEYLLCTGTLLNYLLYCLEQHHIRKLLTSLHIYIIDI